MNKKTIELYKDFHSASIYFDKEVNTLFLQYKEEVKSFEEFQEINQAATKGYQHFKTYKFVADARKMGKLPAECRDYVNNVMIPELFDTATGGDFYLAQLLDSSEIMSKVAAHIIKTGSKEVVDIEQFSDQETLYKRLKEV